MNRNNKTLIFTILAATVVFGSIALGQEGAEHAAGAHEEHGIPRIVYYQALNFFGLIAILVFVLKSKVRTFFTKRHDSLTSALKEAKRLREEAEARHQEYVVKIQNMERESESVLEQMKRDAEDSKRRIIEEANKMAENIRHEAKRTTENELEKAKAELYDQVLGQALDGARSLLGQSIAENDQRRLQKEFVDKIEAVQ